MNSSVCDDLAQLREGGVKPSNGDIRCILFGHMTRVAIQCLQVDWRVDLPTQQRLVRFSDAIACMGLTDGLLAEIISASAQEAGGPLFAQRRKHAVSF